MNTINDVQIKGNMGLLCYIKGGGTMYERQMMFLPSFDVAFLTNYYLELQTWVSGLAFMLGVVLYSGISVVGLTAMEVVPKEMVSSAHGLACAIAQGKPHYSDFSGMSIMTTTCSKCMVELLKKEDKPFNKG